MLLLIYQSKDLQSFLFASVELSFRSRFREFLFKIACVILRILRYKFLVLFQLCYWLSDKRADEFLFSFCFILSSRYRFHYKIIININKWLKLKLSQLERKYSKINNNYIIYRVATKEAVTRLNYRLPEHPPSIYYIRRNPDLVKRYLN